MRTLLTIASTLAALALPASASAVVGGKAVPSGAYPYVVAIGDSKGPECGGTLIEPNVVLTAAHCVDGVVGEPGDLRVLVGSSRISGTAGHLMRVTAFYVHPKYSARSLRYDAALLVLDQPVSGVRTLPMTTASLPAGSTVSAAGWGETREHAKSVPDRLRSVVLKVGTTSSCKHGNSVPGDYFSPSMMCASGPGRDTCSGDSGGPLVGTSDGHLVLVGITSFGLGCAREGHPGVYTRVSAIRGWALAQIARAATASSRLAELQSTAAAAREAGF